VNVEPIDIGTVQRIHTLRSLAGMQDVSTAALAALAATPCRLDRGRHPARHGAALRDELRRAEGDLATRAMAGAWA
jgi:hypothetical protein